MSLLGDQLLLNTIAIQASAVQQTMAAFQANAFWWDLQRCERGLRSIACQLSSGMKRSTASCPHLKCVSDAGLGGGLGLDSGAAFSTWIHVGI